MWRLSSAPRGVSQPRSSALQPVLLRDRPAPVELSPSTSTVILFCDLRTGRLSALRCTRHGPSQRGLRAGGRPQPWRSSGAEIQGTAPCPRSDPVRSRLPSRAGMRRRITQDRNAGIKSRGRFFSSPLVGEGLAPLVGGEASGARRSGGEGCGLSANAECVAPLTLALARSPRRPIRRRGPLLQGERGKLSSPPFPRSRPGLRRLRSSRRGAGRRPCGRRRRAGRRSRAPACGCRAGPARRAGR